MKNSHQLEHLRKISQLLDSQFRGPFGFKFGLDGLLGLIPFVGDFVTTGLSLYILAQAAALGCSPAVMLRMGYNILLENVVDLIPVVGSLFDFVWKANNKNMLLLESHLQNPRAATIKSKILLASISLFIMGFLISSIYITVFILEKVFEWIRLITS